MSPRKLSDKEKTELVRLYRQTDETTATLADRFQVSSSTVSRVLRNNLSSEEYLNLIQRKRHNRQKSRVHSTSNQPPAQTEITHDQEAQPSPHSADLPSTSEAETAENSSSSGQIEISFSANETIPKTSVSLESDETENVDEIDFSVIQAMFGEDVGDDDDLEDAEEEDWEEEEETDNRNQKPKAKEVEVLPLSQAKFPKTCYLVIDRGANLITKPLKEFSDLGKIPSVETQQKTLPIFDNHRVARRFSNRSQKVIKVPDGQMIQKTKEQLEAKGIKRILMDGKVYMLSSELNN
jgi:transposase-like protein